MKENIIIDMVTPYLIDNKLTYKDFDYVFKMLNLSEQYQVLDVLYKKHIKLVDKNIASDKNQKKNDNKEDNFSVLYDNKIFSD